MVQSRLVNTRKIFLGICIETEIPFQKTKVTTSRRPPKTMKHPECIPLSPIPSPLQLSLVDCLLQSTSIVVASFNKHINRHTLISYQEAFSYKRQTSKVHQTKNKPETSVHPNILLFSQTGLPAMRKVQRHKTNTIPKQYTIMSL